MKQSDKKFVCDLISLVANAIASGTISEAEEYLVEKYNGVEDPILEHTFNVLTEIHKKQVGNQL